MNTEIKTNSRTLREDLFSKGCLDALREVGSNIVTPERMANVAWLCVQKTPDLQRCDSKTLISALKHLAILGCEPDGIHGYLVPFNKRDRDGNVVQTVVTPIPSARGLMRMARDCGIRDIHIGVVHKGDTFSWKTAAGKFTMLHEVKDWPEEGEAIGYYCVWRDSNGDLDGSRMSKKEVDAIKDRSRAISGPWVTDYEQMALKTVIKRASKLWPMPTEKLEALKAIDEIENESAPMRNVTPAAAKLVAAPLKEAVEQQELDI